MKLAKRFVDEKLALHWRVDESLESFQRLLYHLEVKTNFRPYFERAMSIAQLRNDKLKEGILVADIGAGVCWTSALLAKHPRVRHVYAVDPSENRISHARFVAQHFRISKDRITIIKGTFAEPNIPEKVNLVLLCGALHHCYDRNISLLFSTLKRLLLPDGVVLIANEHYVNQFWILKRYLSLIKRMIKRQKTWYTFRNPRAPYPFDGEHWRTKKELENIFISHGFKPRFYVHEGDLCKNKHSSYHKIGWRYYYAVLKRW